MSSNKAFLLLALFVALVLVVAARDLAETDSTEKHNEVSTESTNVGKAQYGNGGYNGGNGGYNGGNGGYNGGNGGYNGGNGGHGGGGGGGGGGGRGGGRGGRGGGGCYYGCCRREYYGRGCRRCCSYANEAVEQARP